MNCDIPKSGHGYHISGGFTLNPTCLSKNQERVRAGLGHTKVINSDNMKGKIDCRLAGAFEIQDHGVDMGGARKTWIQ